MNCKGQTWPGTKTLSPYSKGSKGLPLAKMARPCKWQKEKRIKGSLLYYREQKQCEMNKLGCRHDATDDKIYAVDYLAPRIGFFCGAFRLWSWVGKRKNNGFLQAVIHKKVELASSLANAIFFFPITKNLTTYLIQGGHSLNNFFSKCSTLSWCSNQNCWLNCLTKYKRNSI